MSKIEIQDRYIGDGVYASFDGMHIVLDLRAQAPTFPITKIALDFFMLDSLLEFKKHIRKVYEDAIQEEIEADAQQPEINP